MQRNAQGRMAEAKLQLGLFESCPRLSRSPYSAVSDCISGIITWLMEEKFCKEGQQEGGCIGLSADLSGILSQDFCMYTV